MGLQMRTLNKRDHLEAVYDEFCKYGIISKPSVGEFNSNLTIFMQKLQQQINGGYLLEMEEDGYYHTEIIAVRKNVRPNFRCYKIKGHVDEWKGENMPATDWLVFNTGRFEDLEVGDKVRFQIRQTETRYWKDLNFARDIYLNDLQKENI